MRCRKVRSFLSAYCNDELTLNQSDEVADHLDNCADCRKEETFYQAMLDASRKIPAMRSSADFNNKLMNRIAKERFNETRTKAYLPKRAPLLSWTKIVPLAVSAGLVLLASVMTFNYTNQPDTPQPIAQVSGSSGLDDSYLTVMPTNNPNVKHAVANVDKNWSFNNQLAQAERVGQISNRLTGGSSFEFYGNPYNVRVYPRQMIEIPLPFIENYFRIRPVIKVYVSPNVTDGKEDSRGY